MSKLKQLHIKSAKALSGLRLKIVFSDGKTQVVDFSQFLKSSKNSEIKKYAQPSRFAKFSLHHGELMWGDFDLIFPVMDLYENQIDRRVTESKRKVS